MEKKVFINQQARDGAGTILAIEWARGFKANGYTVYATVPNTATNLNEWLEELETDKLYIVKDYEDKNKIDFIKKTAYLILIDQWKIRKKFGGIKFDFSFRTLYGHWNSIIERCIRKDKIVSICHDPVSHSGEKNYFAKAVRQSIIKSDDVVVLTESFVPLVSQNYNIPMEKIHFIPHGRMENYVKCQDDKYKKEYSKDKFNFVFFGRIEKYKGLHVLAEACKILQNKRKDFSITVAGNGDFTEYKNEFNEIENATIINRFIPDQEVGCLFSGPNIVTIVPYLDATQSGVIPIAYEYETPIIASNTGGLKEQLNDGKIGLLFEPGNALELANKMEYIMDNNNEFYRQAELIRNFRKNLNWNVLAKKLLEELHLN